MKILVSIITIFMFSFRYVFALEYVIEWEQINKPKETSFKTIMYNNTCTDNRLKKTKQLELFFYKNNNKNYTDIKDGSPITIQTCYQKQKYTDEELNIKRWDYIKVEKDFILSRELEARGCGDGTIFKRHIPHLKIKNNYPKSKDVNRYFPGEELWIQSCRNEAPVGEKKTPIKEEDFIYFIIGRESILNNKEGFLEVGYNYNNNLTIFQRVSTQQFSFGGFFGLDIMENTSIFVYPHFVFNQDLEDYTSLNYGLNINKKDVYSLKIYNSINNKEDLGVRLDLYYDDYGVYFEQNDFLDTKNFGFLIKF